MKFIVKCLKIANRKTKFVLLNYLIAYSNLVFTHTIAFKSEDFLLL